MVLRAAAYHSGSCPSQRGATVSEVTQSLRTRYPKTYKGWCNFSADLVSAGIARLFHGPKVFKHVLFCLLLFCFLFFGVSFLGGIRRTRSEETPSFAAKLSSCLCSQCGQDVRLFLAHTWKAKNFYSFAVPHLKRIRCDPEPGIRSISPRASKSTLVYLT